MAETRTVVPALGLITSPPKLQCGRRRTFDEPGVPVGLPLPLVGFLWCQPCLFLYPTDDGSAG